MANELLPNEEFALACRAYYDEQGLVVDGNNGQFAHCPQPKRYGDKGYYLLWEHHQQQGLLQSKDVGELCFFVGHAKQWLTECNYFPEKYFELWDIYEEFAVANGKKACELGTGIHEMTTEEKVAAGKKSGRKTYELGIGIHGMTAEERVALGKKTQELGVGVHGMTTEERVANGKKRGEEAYKLGVGIFGMTEEQLTKRNKKNGRPRVQLKVTNFEGVVNTFGSITEAAKELNCNESGVRKRLAAGKPSASGKLKGLLFEKMDG